MVLEPFQGLVHGQERLFGKLTVKGVFTVNSSCVSMDLGTNGVNVGLGNKTGKQVIPTK